MNTNAQANQQHLGKYELRERLGHGGTAEVWKAFDTQLERFVAIKLLHADLRTDPEFITRFSREARLAAGLHHPNIVQIYDSQISQSRKINAPTAYMVMDYIEGETLAQYIYKTSRAGKHPSPTDIVYLFACISKALDYAHREGVVHRDIKPANILLDKRHAAPDSVGEPVLTDFGIAKIVGASSDTMTGMWVGTPLYVSPEQAQGHPATKLSDIYSLGIILYEICTGICPFTSESALAILMQHVSSAPTYPTLINSAIPPTLAEVILRAIAKKPAERFSSASALTAAIAEAFHLPLSASQPLPSHPLNDLTEATYLTPHQPDLPSQRAQEPPTLIAQQFPGIPTSRAGVPVIPTSNIPAPHSLPSRAQNIQATIRLPVSPGKFPPPARPRRVRKGNLIAWFALLLVLASSTVVSLILLRSGHASPATTVGTLTFTNSGQYDPHTTVGYNDIITLSLHSLTSPQSGNAYFAWLMPDLGDDTTSPLLLRRLSVNAGNATFEYHSPTHTNLLAQYSRVRITEQSANDLSTTPSLNPNTWRWEGWIPYTPTPGDIHQYSLLSHLRHLLAKDQILQDNGISGGLIIWMTRNVGKVEEWSSAAEGSWGDGDADLIRRQMLRILDYIDGQTYVGLDVPPGSPWLVDPLAGKLGLLSYTQDQQPPGYLQHADTHLTGLAQSPGHTDEQQQVTVQADSVIQRMITDLTQVRKDAVELVQRNNEQLLQPDALTLLNQMETLAGDANNGWFDPKTHETVGGAIWLNVRIQQLATIFLTVSRQQ